MADIIISFRSVNQLYDCFVYTKELSNVTFDSSVQVIFNFEHFELDGRPSCKTCQDVSKHKEDSFLTSHVHCEQADNPDGLDVTHSAASATPHLCDPENNNNETDVLLCVNACGKCVLLMDAHLACCVAKYVQKDRIFRHRFFRFVKRNYGFYQGIDETHWTTNTPLFECGYLNVDYSIDVFSVWPKQKINYLWCQRLQLLVAKRCQLEESMAWLSTLGGGFSSLGDYFTYCADKAGEISIHQLKLAIEMSDPVMASKCRVFWAQSLLQRGYLKLCRKIIWNEFQNAKRSGLQDTKLDSMCKSTWNRLKYMFKLQKSKRSSNKIL